MHMFDTFKTLLKLAYRNNLRQKRRSLIVAATALVGIFTVNVSQSFINGMMDSLVIVAIETGPGHVQIRPAGYLDSRTTGMRLTNADVLEEQFKNALPDGVSYSPRMEREAILRLGAEIRGVLLMGVDPVMEKNVSKYSDWVVRGTFFKEDQDEKEGPMSGMTPCLIGTKNADFLEVGVDDRVIVSTGGVDGNTETFACRITGIFQSPSGMLDERIVIMKRSDLSRIRNDGPEKEISYFVFHGKKLEDAESIQSALRSSIGKSDQDKIEIATIWEMEPSVHSLFELYDQMTVIMYFIILMGFGIILFESVTMSIFERMKEIGIMHAIGTRSSHLFWMVILESFLLTLLGTLFGMLLGLIGTTILYYTGVNFEGLEMGTSEWGGGIGVVHPYLTMYDMFEGFIVATVISFLSGFYPARKAVKISPIDAIYNR